MNIYCFEKLLNQEKTMEKVKLTLIDDKGKIVNEILYDDVAEAIERMTDLREKYSVELKFVDVDN